MRAIDRVQLLTRVSVTLDGLPAEVMPMGNVGSASDFLAVPADTSDDDALVGLAAMVEDLCLELRITWDALNVATRAAPDPWSSPEWQAIVAAYRRTGKRRPSQLEVAEELGLGTEQPIRDRLRAVGVERWSAVHALIAAGRPPDQ